ncbi:hypothetical protein DdX_22307 [Ditylenchus destructor]|uniref:Uncharacterized protein n=1 Tax=Ditylenchus destructor TaxID=166010 RepID=A0AAD4MHQ9_9BILA|nr:hypothetical protein DdX_22307 [Ditylenchus destructor]
MILLSAKRHGADELGSTRAFPRAPNPGRSSPHRSQRMKENDDRHRFKDTTRKTSELMETSSARFTASISRSERCWSSWERTAPARLLLPFPSLHVSSIHSGRIDRVRRGHPVDQRRHHLEQVALASEQGGGPPAGKRQTPAGLERGVKFLKKIDGFFKPRLPFLTTGAVMKPHKRPGAPWDPAFFSCCRSASCRSPIRCRPSRSCSCRPECHSATGWWSPAAT